MCPYSKKNENMLIKVREDYGIPKAISSKRLILATTAAVICIVIPIVVSVIDPIQILAAFGTRIAEGSLVYNMLQREKVIVELSLYLFNVTNADRFLAGLDHSLKIEEVGPFVYNEVRYNEDIDINYETGTMHYTPKVWAEFYPEKSIGRPQDFNITMPNIVMLGLTSLVSSYSFWLKGAYNVMLSNKGTPFVTMSAQDYLWGYDDPLIKIGNSFAPGWINFEKMGILDRLYDKKKNTRIEVGSKNDNKFKVMSVDGEKGLGAWGYDNPYKRSKCNSFNDSYEGIAYPTALKPETPVRIYRQVLCRMIELDFHNLKDLGNGAQGLEYVLSNRTYMKNPDNECLCKRGLCRDGLSDISPCFYDLPLAISNPHFMDADPALLQQKIEGINPDKSKHSSYFVIEPKIGMVLETQLQLQLNVVIKDVSFNHNTKRLSNMVLPITYFKITQPILDDEQKNVIFQMYILGPVVVLTAQILFPIVAFILLVYLSKLLYRNWMYSDRGMAFQLPCDDEKTAIIIGVETPLMEYEKL